MGDSTKGLCVSILLVLHFNWFTVFSCLTTDVAKALYGKFPLFTVQNFGILNLLTPDL